MTLRQKNIYHWRIVKKSMRMLDESSKIAHVRCIEDVTSDLKENHMKFDTERDDEETEEVHVGEPKSVEVLHPLQKTKILVFTCFYLQYHWIYRGYI